MEWVIGDIHGCLDELNELLEQIPPKDKLIFLGDYVDRGPDSFGVVERLIKENKRSIFLKGNHETMLLSFFKSPPSERIPDSAFILNGGKATLKSYGLKRTDNDIKQLPTEHLKFYQNLQNYYEASDYIAVHAGVRIENGTDLAEQNADDLQWIRMDWLRSEHKWPGKKVYYGHTPTLNIYGEKEQKRLIQGEKSTGLDTGCVYGGYLSAINTKTGDLLQVKAKKSYV